MNIKNLSLIVLSTLGLFKPVQAMEVLLSSTWQNPANELVHSAKRDFQPRIRVKKQTESFLACKFGFRSLKAHVYDLSACLSCPAISEQLKRGNALTALHNYPLELVAKAAVNNYAQFMMPSLFDLSKDLAISQIKKLPIVKSLIKVAGDFTQDCLGNLNKPIYKKQITDPNGQLLARGLSYTGLISWQKFVLHCGRDIEPNQLSISYLQCAKLGLIGTVGSIGLYLALYQNDVLKHLMRSYVYNFVRGQCGSFATQWCFKSTRTPNEHLVLDRNQDFLTTARRTLTKYVSHKTVAGAAGVAFDIAMANYGLNPYAK